MLPGTQRVVVTPGNNEKRQLAGAYDPLHQRLVYVEGDRKASWLFLHLLRALLVAYHRLPLDCPNENRIERLWLELHANVTRNHQCPTMRDLIAAVRRYLRERFDLIEILAYAA